MKGTDTKSVLTIELDTQEALSRISEMRVDLELPDKHNAPQVQVKTQVNPQVAEDNQRKMYAKPVKSGHDSVRRATVKVNSVEAHITNKASF